MPKQVLENGKVKIVLDPNDPKYAALIEVAQVKNMPLDKIPAQAKAKIFDAFVRAGIIQI